MNPKNRNLGTACRKTASARRAKTALAEAMAQGSRPEALVARVAEGDRAALSELYDRYAPGLWGVVWRILPDRDAAEEVIASVFLRLWNEARRFSRARASVAAWLLLMARAAAVDRQRAARKLPPLVLHPDPFLKSLSWLPCPEEIALLEERRDLLRKVVNQLPKPQRGALELAVIEGYTEAEIAARLGEPRGRVESTLRAGMRFLKHRLRAVLGTWTANI